MSRMRVAMLAGLATASAVAAACGNFSGSDNGGATDTTDSGVLADATIAAPTDAGVDGSSSTGKDAGAVRFCFTQDAAYCADFDDPNVPLGPFESLHQTDASLALVDADFVSPPAALALSASAQYDDAGNAATEALLFLQAIPIGAGRHLEFDVRITSASLTGTIVQMLGYYDGGRPTGGYVFSTPSGQLSVATFFSDGGGAGFSPIAGQIVNHPWMHFSLDLVHSQPSTSVNLTVTVGSTPLAQMNEVVIPGNVVGVQLNIGAQPQGEAGVFEVLVDNVIVR